MATPKKDRNDYGSFDFDSDLNFDFSADGIPDERPTRERKPVDHLLEGVKSSVKNKFTDPSTYTTIVRDALPEGFSKTWDTGEELISDTSRLYDQSISEVKPYLASIMRKIDSLTPEGAGRFKRWTRETSQSMSGERKYAYDSRNDEEDGLSRMMEETLGKYAEESEDRRKEDAARKILDDKIADDKFQTSFKLQERLTSAAIGTRDYLTGFQAAATKKSLELQYRSYFAIASLVKSFNEYAKVDDTLKRGILKNTGLPEYAKVKETERFAQVAKDKAFGAIQDNLFGTTDRIGSAATKIKKALKNQMDDFKENLSLLDDVMESALSQKEMDKMMAEMEGREYSGWQTTGSTLGSAAGEWVSGKISKQLKKLAEKNPTLMKASFVSGRYAQNPGALVDKIRNSGNIQGMEFGTPAQELAYNILTGLMDFMGDQKPDMKVGKGGIGEENENDAYTATRVKRAQADVVPGYLARILRELQVMRTGNDKIPLTVYDASTGSFRQEQSVARDVMASIRKDANTQSSTYKRRLNENFDEFTKGEEFDSAETEEVKDMLGRLSRKTNFDYTGENILDTKEVKDLSPSARAKVEKILKDRYSGENYDSLKNRYAFTTRSMQMRDETRDHRGVIRKAIADGLGPALEQEGLVKRNEAGEYEVVAERYYSEIDKGAREGDWKSTDRKKTDWGAIFSDMTMKENIQKLPPGNRAQSLNGIVNTPNFSWNYRATTGLAQDPKVGPMAQDVQRNLGEATAPGGNQIDLVNMNGHMFNAIQELNKRVDEGIDSNGLKYLKSIDDSLKKIAGGSMLSMGNPLAGMSMPDMSGLSQKFNFQGDGVVGNLISALLNAGSAGASKLKDSALGLGGFLKNKVAQPGAEKLGKFYDDHKDGAKKGLDTLWNAVIAATNRAVEFGSNVVFQSAPKAIAQARAWAQKGIAAGVKLFNDAKDVYIPGLNGPVLREQLMRMGVYRDQATDRVIKTLDDLAKISGNVIDHTGKVVLSIEDMANGVFTQDGKPIKALAQKAFDWARDKLTTGFQTGKKMLSPLLAKGKDLASRGMEKAKDLAAAGRDKAAEAGQAVMGHLPSLAIGTGSCECWTRPTLILEQIRDLLALGKKGKRVRSILDRSNASIMEATTPEEKSEDSLPQTQRSLLTQIRDANLIDKPLKTIDLIMGQGARAAEYLQDRTTGIQNSNLFRKFKEFKKGLEEKIGGNAPVMVGPQLPSPDYYGPQLPGGQSMVSSAGSGVLGMLGRIAPGAATALGGMANKGGGLLSGLAGKLRGKGRFGKLAGAAAGLGGGLLGRFGGILGKAGGALGGLLGGGGGEQNQEGSQAAAQPEATNAPGAGSYMSQLLAKGRDRAMKAYRKATGKFNDKDGDGQRDGGAADRAQEAEDRRQVNEQRKQDAISASQSGLEKNKYMDGGGLGSIFGMVTKMLGLVSSSAMSILGGAASLLTTGMSLKRGAGALGGLGKGAGKLAKLGGAAGRGILAAGSGLLGMGGKAMGALRTIGTPIASAVGGAGGILSKVPGVARLASWGGVAARAAMAVGLASGGAGGMIIGALGGAASAVAAALSSPVVLGAAAVAATAYGGFKLYKYMTRNNIDEWQRIRIIQYGLDGTTATESYNNQVLALEGYLQDGRIGYRGKTPYILDRTVDIKEILEIFSIDSKDQRMVDNLATWIQERFKPVFLHHLAALAQVSMKAKLSDLDSLKPEQKLEYLSKAGFESGPYNVTTSPFKGLDILNTDIQAALNIVNAKIQTVGKEIQKNVKRDLKDGQDKPKGADAKNANVAISSAANSMPTIPNIPDAAKDKAATTHPGIKNNAGGPKPFDPGSGTQEDGADAKTRDSTIVSDKAGPESGAGGGSTGSLATAGGPLADGSSGMKYVKLGKDAELDGMQPTLMKHFLAMAQEYGEATGKSLQVNEAFRSYQRQAALYRANPAKAAKPGNSMHEHGLAMDISSVQLEELEQMGLLRKYGFTRPIGGETWHIEPAGIQGSEKLAKQDKSYADMAIQSSLGRGGGGHGSIKGTKLGSRNPKLAMELYNASGGKKVETKSMAEASPTNDLKPPQIDGATKAAGDDRRKDKIAASAGPGMANIGKDQSVQFSGNVGTDIATKPMQGPSGSTEASMADGEAKPSDSAAGAKSAGGGVRDVITSAAKEAGVNPNDMLLMSAMESSLKPGAKAGNAMGLNQFMPGTWRETTQKAGSKYGLNPNSDPFDPRNNTLMGAEYMKGNLKILGSARPNPTFTDAYMAHFLGPYGAKKFFNADPETEAAQMFPAFAKNPINAKLFYDKNRPLSTSEMYSRVENKIGERAKEFGIPYNPVGLKGPPAAYSKETVSLTDENRKIPEASSVANFNVPQSAMRKKDPTVQATDSSRARSGDQIAVPEMRTRSQDTSVSAAPQAQAEGVGILAAAAREQTNHLSTISRALLEQIVPILREIRDKSSSGSDSEGSNKEATPAGQETSREQPVPSPFSRATPSSFDNRRTFDL